MRGYDRFAITNPDSVSIFTDFTAEFRVYLRGLLGYTLFALLLQLELSFCMSSALRVY